MDIVYSMYIKILPKISIFLWALSPMIFRKYCEKLVRGVILVNISVQSLCKFIIKLNKGNIDP